MAGLRGRELGVLEGRVVVERERVWDGRRGARRFVVAWAAFGQLAERRPQEFGPFAERAGELILEPRRPGCAHIVFCCGTVVGEDVLQKPLLEQQAPGQVTMLSTTSAGAGRQDTRRLVKCMLRKQ